MTKLLRESTATPLTKSGNRWRAVLAVPGQGSSGKYSEEVLREFGPRALAPGAKAFVDHDPKRSPKDMIGIYPDGAWYEEGVGLVGELEVFPHWKEFVETVGPHAGLSIYMMGESDEDGNVTSLIADRQNGVDLVSYAGLEGSGLAEKLYESAKLAEQKPSAASVQEKEAMDKELLEALAALKESIDSLATDHKAAAEAEVKAEADAEAVKIAVKEALDARKEAEKAVNDAKLLPAQAKAVLEAAEDGEDIAKLIEDAKAVRDEAIKVLSEGKTVIAGRVVESGASDEDFSVPELRFS